MLNIRTPLAELVVKYLTNIISHEVQEYNALVKDAGAAAHASANNTFKRYKEAVICFKKSATVFKNGILKDYLADLNDVNKEVNLNTFVEEFQHMYLTFLKVESIEMSIRYFNRGQLDSMLCHLSKQVLPDCIGELYELAYSDKIDYNESLAKPFIAIYCSIILLLKKYNLPIKLDNDIESLMCNIKNVFRCKVTDKFTAIFLICLLLKEIDSSFDIDKAIEHTINTVKGTDTAKEDLSTNELEELGQIQRVENQPTSDINSSRAVSIQSPTSVDITQSQTASAEIFNKRNVTNVTINRKPDSDNAQNDSRYSALVKTGNYNDSNFKG